MMPRLLRKERASRCHKGYLDGPAAGGRSQERPPLPFPSGRKELRRAAFYAIYLNILKCAKSEARLLLDSDEPEKVKFCNEVKNSLERWSKYICFN